MSVSGQRGRNTPEFGYSLVGMCQLARRGTRSNLPWECLSRTVTEFESKLNIARLNIDDSLYVSADCAQDGN